MPSTNQLQNEIIFLEDELQRLKSQQSASGDDDVQRRQIEQLRQLTQQLDKSTRLNDSLQQQNRALEVQTRKKDQQNEELRAKFFQQAVELQRQASQEKELLKSNSEFERVQQDLKETEERYQEMQRRNDAVTHQLEDQQRQFNAMLEEERQKAKEAIRAAKLEAAQAKLSASLDISAIDRSTPGIGQVEGGGPDDQTSRGGRGTTPLPAVPEENTFLRDYSDQNMSRYNDSEQLAETQDRVKRGILRLLPEDNAFTVSQNMMTRVKRNAGLFRGLLARVAPSLFGDHAVEWIKDQNLSDESPERSKYTKIIGGLNWWTDHKDLFNETIFNNAQQAWTAQKDLFFKYLQEIKQAGFLEIFVEEYFSRCFYWYRANKTKFLFCHNQGIGELTPVNFHLHVKGLTRSNAQDSFKKIIFFFLQLYDVALVILNNNEISDILANTYANVDKLDFKLFRLFIRTFGSSFDGGNFVPLLTKQFETLRGGSVSKTKLRAPWYQYLNSENGKFFNLNTVLGATVDLEVPGKEKIFITYISKQLVQMACILHAMYEMDVGDEKDMQDHFLKFNRLLKTNYQHFLGSEHKLPRVLFCSEQDTLYEWSTATKKSFDDPDANLTYKNVNDYYFMNNGRPSATAGSLSFVA